MRYSGPVKNRAQIPFYRLGLAIPLTLGLMGGAALADGNTRPPPPASSFPGSPPAEIAPHQAGGKIEDARQSLCTWATCGPQRADSPWTLAGFGLAAGATAWLGRRPRRKSGNQSTQSASG